MTSFFSNVLRTEDFLYLQFEFLNLTLDTATPTSPLLKRTSSESAYIIVRFPPQHIAEKVAQSDFDQMLPFRGVVSCPSRITFKLAADFTKIAYRLDLLLELISQSEITNTLGDGALATNIEFPYRLLLVPPNSTQLYHQIKPVISSKTHQTELWHTQINIAGNEPVRFMAISNPKDVIDNSENPLLTTLTWQNRKDIVERCTPGVFAIASSRFILTALGASAKLKSDWPLNIGNSQALTSWEHHSEIGRDYYVRTVEQGYCFPFGHRTAITTIVERKFQPNNIAKLVQSKILTFEEYDKSFEHLESVYRSRGREMPFTVVRITTKRREIVNNDDPILVDAAVIDVAGNLVNCSLTVFFVPEGDAKDESKLKLLRQVYESENHCMVQFANQRIVIAEDNGGQGDTSLNIEKLKFGVNLQSELSSSVFPAYLPYMVNAQIKIPALEHLLGTVASGSGSTSSTSTITFHESYLALGFSPENKKQVFVKFVAAITGISIPAQRAGGLAAPKFPDIDGLSRLVGPISGVDRLEISPAEMIGESKLLGNIALKDIIIPADTDSLAFTIDQAHKLWNLVEDPKFFLSRPVMTTINNPTGIETRFLWKPKIKEKTEIEGAKFSWTGSPPGGGIELILKGRITKNITSVNNPPSFEVEGKLKNFQLDFFEIITVKFFKVEFKSSATKKVDVKVDFAGVDFGSKLTFVKKLQEALPLDSLGIAPSIQQQPDGILVRYSIPIPSAPLGVFSIQNITLSSSLSLPFVEGKPTIVRFALSERNNPFLVTVSIFGGTGFFAIEVRTDGSLRVEAAIEFGGIISLNLLVVNGGVYLLAGIYLSMESGGKLLITGYLRIGGFVDVLGLVSVSIEILISLTYDFGRKVLRGSGRVTVAVKLLFFSESFSFKVHKEISGFGEPPTNIDDRSITPDSLILESSNEKVALDSRNLRKTTGEIMNRQQWAKYCAAFS